MRLALGLGSFHEPVGVRGDHGAWHQGGEVLHDRGARRSALGRPGTRLGNGRHCNERDPFVDDSPSEGDAGRAALGASVSACGARSFKSVRYVARFLSTCSFVLCVSAVRSTRRDLSARQTRQKATALRPLWNLEIRNAQV